MGPEEEGTVTIGMKACPFCAEEIHVEAVKCKHCGEFLDASKRPTPPPPPPLPPPPPAPTAVSRSATTGSNAATKLGVVLTLAAATAWCGGVTADNSDLTGFAMIAFPLGLLLFVLGRSRVRQAQKREAA